MTNRLDLSKPYYLTCSLRETSIQENINCIRNAIYDGAEAFMFHMEKVPDEELTLENLKLLYAYAGDRPIISVNYRSRHKPGKNDEEIIAQQLMSIEAGADCVDMFGDIYNPSVNEIAMDEEIEKSIEESEGKLHIYRAIQALKSPMRDVVMLRLTGDLSFKEIGDVMGQSENWARVTFYRAKQILGKELGNE